MTIIETFRKNLDDHGASKGGRFVKADFHVHVPSGSDYLYKEEDGFEQLGGAITDAALSFAVILDHQKFTTNADLSRLQKFCPNTTLIPGVEINVFVDALTKKVGKDIFYHCIVALDPSRIDEAPAILMAARKQLTYRDDAKDYPHGFVSSIVDVARFFREEKCLFIPAHLHSKDDAHKSRSIDDVYEDEVFLSLVRDGLFDALEVREKATATFFDGHKSTANGIDIPHSVCLRSSDAHHHEHIADRKRSTWVQVETNTYDELVGALRFPHRTKLEEPIISHARIEGLHIEGQYLPDLWLHFHPAMNCFIGCKGSGKTSILECLRFVLDTHVPQQRVEDVRKHLEHILGSAGSIECLITRSDGTTRLIRRRMSSSDRIEIIQTDDTVIEHEDLSSLEFDISILGWHEIESVAESPDARIRLVDEAKGAAQIESIYDSIKSHVTRAAERFPQFQAQLKLFQHQFKRVIELRKQRDTLKQLEKDNLIQLQDNYESHLQTTEEISDIYNKLVEKFDNIDVEIQETILFPEKLADVSSPSLDGIDTTRSAYEAALKNFDEIAKNATDNIKSGVQTARDVVKALDVTAAINFRQFRDETYQPAIDALPSDDRSILSKQVQILEQTKELPKHEAECQGTLDKLIQTCQYLIQECKQVTKGQTRARTLRETWVNEINADLNGSVRLIFKPSGNQTTQQRTEQKLGSQAGAYFATLKEYDGQSHYDRIVKLLEKCSSLTLKMSEWDIKDVIWEADFARLLDVLDDDDVVIELQVGENQYRPLKHLSAGQRCTAVFPLILRNQSGPLVIDQPEDNLDNRYIAKAVAIDLAGKKKIQQFMVTSHNANLVVLTDSDLIYEVDSDGQTGTIKSAGFLSCPTSPVVQSVIDVLDGGADAIHARQRKYFANSETN